MGVDVSAPARARVCVWWCALAWLACAGCGDGDGGDAQPVERVEVSIVVDGVGVVRGDGGGALSGVACEGECVEAVSRGASVALSAEAAAGYVFVGWSGSCGGTGVCELQVTDLRSVTATFRPVCPEPWSALLEGGGQVQVEAASASPSGEALVVAGRFIGSLSAQRALGERGLSGPLERASVEASGEAQGAGFVASFETRRCTLSWLVSLGGDASVTSLALDESGNAVIGGSFEGSLTLGARAVASVGGRDLFVARLSGARGAVLWSKTLGGAADESRSLVAVGRDNTIFWAGRFEGTTMLDGVSLTSAGGQDIFSASLNQTNGRRRWSQRFGGLGDETPTRLLVASDGDALLLGDSAGGFIGEGDEPPSGVSAAFVTRLSARSGAPRWAVEVGAESEGDESLATGGAYAELEPEVEGQASSSVVAVGLVEPSGQALVGVDAVTGEVLWRTSLGGGVPPASVEDARPLGPRLVSAAGGFVAVTTLSDEVLLEGEPHTPAGPSELMRVVVGVDDGALAEQEVFGNASPLALRGVTLVGDVGELWVGDFEGQWSVGDVTLSASGRDGFLVRWPPR